MRTAALTGALLLAVASACGDRERTQVSNATDNVIPPASEPVQSGGAADTARSFGFEERQEFAQTMREQLADLDRQIEELAAQAKSAGGAVSDRALADIRASRQAVGRNLERVDNATTQNWEEIRGAVERGVESLTESVEAAYPK